MDALGIKKLVAVLHLMVISKYSSGREKMDVHGMRTLAVVLQRLVTSRYSSGQEKMDVLKNWWPDNHRPNSFLPLCLLVVHWQSEVFSSHSWSVLNVRNKKATGCCPNSWLQNGLQPNNW